MVVFILVLTFTINSCIEYLRFDFKNVRVDEFIFNFRTIISTVSIEVNCNGLNYWSYRNIIIIIIIIAILQLYRMRCTRKLPKIWSKIYLSVTTLRYSPMGRREAVKPIPWSDTAEKRVSWSEPSAIYSTLWAKMLIDTRWVHNMEYWSLCI